MKKIKLDITPAVVDYATKYGALYEKGIGWYCLEPVPIELEDFVESSFKFKKPYDEKYIKCLLCGGQMRIKTTHRGSMFWGCMRYPKCKATRSVDETDGPQSIKVLKSSPSNKNNKENNKSHKYIALAKLGIKEFGHQKEFENWLTKPKIALGGKRPIEFINSKDGMNKVMSLLRKINQ